MKDSFILGSKAHTLALARISLHSWFWSSLHNFGRPPRPTIWIGLRIQASVLLGPPSNGGTMFWRPPVLGAHPMEGTLQLVVTHHLIGLRGHISRGGHNWWVTTHLCPSATNLMAARVLKSCDPPLVGGSPPGPYIWWEPPIS